MQNVIQVDKDYVASTYARFPLQIAKGKGSIAVDECGKKYIDLTTGIAVNTFGFANAKWQRAVIKQIKRVQHTSNLYFNEPCALLAKELCKRTGYKKVFFSNSGAEANECAIKLARKYGETQKGKDCFTIITLKNSFHGRTITTLSATGQSVFHEHFTPMTEGFVYGTANDIEDIRFLAKTHNCCAIMFELIQGEGGVNPLDRAFVDGLVEIAKQENLLLIADEVQTGNGRTGSLYAYEQYGFTPDIVTTAKGLGGGLPIGATLMGDKVEKLFTPGLNGSTFGGNPVACAGALSILSQINEKTLALVKQKSEYIRKELTGAKGIKSVSGMGLMLGIETEKDAGDIAARCLAKGVMVLKAKEKVRLLPALNIPQNQLEKAIKILKEVCER